MKACCRAWLMLIRLAGSNIRIWSNKSFSWCTFLRWSSGSRWHPIKSANRSLVGLMVLMTVTFSYKYKNGNLVEQKQRTKPLSLSQSASSSFSAGFSCLWSGMPLIITRPHKSPRGQGKSGNNTVRPGPGCIFRQQWVHEGT